MRDVLHLRVAFAHTDAMGVAWHGNYVLWFEQARTELLRHSAFPYPKLVAAGIHLPVIECVVHYRRPARYDDLLVVRCGAESLRGLRLAIGYRIELHGELVAEGRTVHAFTDAAGKVRRPPREILDFFAATVAAYAAP